MAATTERSAGDTTIRPFTVEIPEADLEDLRARIAATRLPEKETVEDDSQGVPLALMQDLARYWATEYDWRKCEARLNALPNFITEIDGLDIHFIHVRSKHEDALPLVVCHGWPGSIVEQLKLIGPLTDPTAHGASASDAFHVVIPSMPGYGFSGKPTTHRLGSRAHREGLRRAHEAPRLHAVRRAGRRLGRGRRRRDGRRPRRPGGRRAGTAGADRHPHQHGRRDPAGALHRGLRRQPGAVRSLRRGAEHVRAAAHVLCDARGVRAVSWGRVRRRSTDWRTHPSPSPRSCSTTATGAVSPAWFSRSSRSVCERPSDLTRDDILDNITLFWLTNTGVSSARLYWENKLPFFSVKGVKVPVGVSTFADEIYRVPRSWAEQAYPNLVSYNQHDRGGHFAAWEQPQLLSEDVRATFRSLR